MTPQDLFRPLQPAIDTERSLAIGYTEVAPSGLLKPYIYCYWLLRSEGALPSPFIYRIVSDGCVDLLINCTAFDRLIIAGTANSSTTVAFDGRLEYFGIRFLPGCFNYFFTLPLKEIANTMLPCHDVWGNRLDEFESRLFAARSMADRIKIAESFLLERLVTHTKGPDARTLAMLEKIYRQHGHMPIEKNPAGGLSPRQLRRLFDHDIGVSPKTFARIVRFQSVLRAMRHAPKSEWGQLCFDFGYYDQPHFIHEFNDFFGLPPMSVNFPGE